MLDAFYYEAFFFQFMIAIQTANNKYEYASPNKSKHNDLMPVKGFMQNKNGHKQLNSWIKILNKTQRDKVSIFIGNSE